jgi:hypothetical protein
MSLQTAEFDASELEETTLIIPNSAFEYAADIYSYTHNLLSQ